MAKLSKLTRRLRLALEHEQLASQLDESMVEWFSNMLADGEVDDDRSEELVDTWTPYFDGVFGEGNTEAAREACRSVLTHFRSHTEHDAGSSGDSSPEVLPMVRSGGVPLLAVSAAHASADVEGEPPEGKTEEVWGLNEWLRRLNLVHYALRARDWCKNAGAVDVEEIIESYAEFCEDLQLKDLERRRVVRDCEEMRDRRSSGESVPVDGARPGTRAAGAKVAQPKAGGPRAEWMADGSDVPAPHGLFRAESYTGGAANVRHRSETFGPPEDPYILIHEIGAGVTATVYKCTRGNAIYAAKAITLSRFRRQSRDCKVALEKLHRESQILYHMRNSHIVSLYDVVETKDKLYLVMEYLDGGELTQYIAKHENGALSEHEARYVFLQLVLGLRYIHAKGVVHRDLKPQNILVDRKATRPGLIEVKISDFGQSKLVNDGYDIARTQVGTPLFWAPEVDQLSSKGYDQTVDLWSMGILLYVMLEGRHPAPGEDLFTEEARMSPGARDLVQRLIRRRPAERLSLEGCLAHPWVMMRGGSLSKVVARNEEVERVRRGERERRAMLPRDPQDVTRLRRELQDVTVQFQLPALMRRRQVALCYSNDNSSEQVDSTWKALMRILQGHFPSERIERHDWVPPVGLAGAFAALPPVDETMALDAGAEFGASEDGHDDDPVESLVGEAFSEVSSATGPPGTHGSSLGGSLGGAREDAAAPEVEESEGPRVTCSRVCMTNDQHDEKTDKDRFPVTRGAPVKQRSVYSHLSKACSGVTGFLSFGKPGVLVFEGPVDAVKDMVVEVKRLPGWFYAKEKWFDREGVQDVERWRVFPDFAKVRFEELRDLFGDEKLKHLDVFEEVLPKHRTSRAKHKT